MSGPSGSGKRTSTASGTWPPSLARRTRSTVTAWAMVTIAAMAKAEGAAYERAGVDLRAAERTTDLIRRAVESTYTSGVIRGLGAFGGLFELPDGMRRPVLVASTDGVGTKTVLANRYRLSPGVLEGVGSDLVNHCVNDILVQGASPLFFLDYVASAHLEPEVTAALVTGVAAACRAAGMALLGGETAEMPGVYAAGEFDLAGTIVGVVERDAVVDGSSVGPGDVLLALPSGGLQTNGFSLARRALEGRLEDEMPDGSPVWQALLARHESFLPAVRPLLERRLAKAMAHVTGGGLPGNVPRTLPSGLGAEVRRGTWEEPEVFALIQRHGRVSDAEMFEVFNMGIGFVVTVDAGAADEAMELSPGLLQVGVVVEGEGVRIV